MPDLDRLEQLARMRDQGTLTQEEFLKAKQALLNPERRRPIGALVVVVVGAVAVLMTAAVLLLNHSTNAPAVSGAVSGQDTASVTDNSINAQEPEGPLKLANEPAPASGLIAEMAKFTEVGQCKETQVAVIGNRLEGTPDSGTSITYTDGTFGVSYETVTDAEGSRPGDQVKLCLVERPKDCPAGSDPEQGSVFSAENYRTGGRWSLPNSSHECGGA